MTLRDDVRNYFEREALQAPAPAGLRADVTSRALSAPARQAPALRWAAVLAALLAVAIVAGLVATGAFRQNRGQIPVGPPIPVTPGTHGFVFDVSFANSTDGWALVGWPIGDLAQYAVEATHDGGSTWLTPVNVGTTFNLQEADAPRHIHFVDRDDGFVYGLGWSYATHDGGRSWSDAGLPAGVEAIVGQEGVVWAVNQTAADAVRISADGGKTWLPTASLFFIAGDATSFGISGLIVTGANQDQMAITTDAGSTWRELTDQCPAGTSLIRAATADGREIWEVCSFAPSRSNVSSYVFVSEDSGTTWQQRMDAALGVGFEALLSPAAGTAQLATDTSGLQISHDSGATWQACVTDGDPKHAIRSFSYSADGSLAVAVDTVYVVWISRDGGDNWVRTSGQP